MPLGFQRRRNSTTCAKDGDSAPTIIHNAPTKADLNTEYIFPSLTRLEQINGWAYLHVTGIYRPRLGWIQSGMRFLAKNPEQRAGKEHRDCDEPEGSLH